MAKISLEKFEKINKNDFLIGFEVECVSDGDKISGGRFKKKIHDLRRRISIGHDGSIRRRAGGRVFDETMEIKTPVLPAKEAFELLEKIFEVVDQYGYTNRSCGFHVNVSPVSNRLYAKCNPFFLAKHPIWKRIKKSFKRERNGYCSNVVLSKEMKTRPISILKQTHSHLGRAIFNNPLHLWNRTVSNQNVSWWQRLRRVNGIRYQGHYSVVNFDNLHPRRTGSSRLEVRGFGNTDYHKKLDKIAPYVDKILGIFVESTIAEKV